MMFVSEPALFHGPVWTKTLTYISPIVFSPSFSQEPEFEGSPPIVQAPLCGMDLIWKIALHAKSPIVGTKAIDFLSSLIKVIEIKAG